MEWSAGQLHVMANETSAMCLSNASPDIRRPLRTLTFLGHVSQHVYCILQRHSFKGPNAKLICLICFVFWLSSMKLWKKMLTFWVHHSVTQYHSIGQTRRKLLLCISFPHIFSSFASFLASTGCTNHAVSVRYFPPVPAVSKALRTTGRTSSVDHDSWRWPGVSCWVFILFYYFFFCSISSPLADHTNKTTLGSLSRSRTQEGAKICKYVLALMRDDYVQRRFESFINVSVWLAHIINEGRAPSCFIFIPIDHLKVCQIALCLYLK